MFKIKIASPTIVFSLLWENYNVKNDIKGLYVARIAMAMSGFVSLT